MKQPLNSLLTIAALVAASATFAEDVTEGIFPSVTPTCAVDPTTCIEGYVTRPDITVRMRLGKGDFDHFIQKNGLEGMGITPDTLLPEGPLMIQS